MTFGSDSVGARPRFRLVQRGPTLMLSARRFARAAHARLSLPTNPLHRLRPAIEFDDAGYPSVTEPFGLPRSAARRLFDFGVMVACMKTAPPEDLVLDFGAGTGWITEWLARLGHPVVAFDVHGGLGVCLQRRVEADLGVRAELITYEHGDGHAMPFTDDSFDQVLCFDTLHHMHDFAQVFREFARVLKPGGRAVFVEPGAGHSRNPETIAFVAEQKAYDPTWIERDIILEEIDAVARGAGLSGLTIVPVPRTESLMKFSLPDWRSYRRGWSRHRTAFAKRLVRVNHHDRVIFHCDKV